MFVAFIGLGFAFASWASRIPQVRVQLQLSAGQLGLVLLAIACGSVLSLSVAGPAVARFGSKRVVQCMSLLLAAGLVVVAIGYETGVPLLVIGLFVFGCGQGAWDVAMNVQGAHVEHRLGRAIMPRFHAGYSLGTVLGAVAGAGMVAAHVSVTVQLVGTAVVVALAVTPRIRHFGPDHVEPTTRIATGAPKPPRTRSAWTEPRTLLIGVVVLTFTVAEGAGNDWIGVGAISGHGLPAAVGTLAFALFLAAMTIVRWFGTRLLDRYGRVPVVRTLAIAGAAGVLLFTLVPVPAIAFIGVLLWGCGASLGFPVGMSAAADDPTRAAARVGVVAAIGYCAFLAGPPAIGFLSNDLGVLHALASAAALLCIAAVLATVLRDPGARFADSTTPGSR